MDAKGLVSALLAFYEERRIQHAVSAADLLIHAYSVAYGVPGEEAEEYVADELVDLRAARG